VLNLVGKVLDSADGNGLFWRILRTTVGFGHMRQHHLGISLGSKSARLQKGLSVVDTSSVHVHSCVIRHIFAHKSLQEKRTSFNIVQGVGDSVQLVEKSVVENLFGVAANSIAQRGHIETWVETLGSLCCNCRFFTLKSIRMYVWKFTLYIVIQAAKRAHPNVVSPEQKLSVQIGNLNLVHVGDGDAAVLGAAQTDHGEILQQLAPNGTRSNLLKTDRRIIPIDYLTY